MSRPPLPWRVRVAESLGPVVLAGLMRTLDFQIDTHPETAHHRAHGKAAIYAVWHGRLLPLVFLHRERGGAILVSQHRDGEAITRVSSHFGFTAARGSTTRGGARGLLELVRLAEEGWDVGVTPDGPRGPREVVQSGVLTAARQTGLPIVPVATAGVHAWRLKSWDQFMIPKPFSTVFVRYGKPLWIDTTDDDHQLSLVQAGLDEAAHHVDLAERNALASEPAHS